MQNKRAVKYGPTVILLLSCAVFSAGCAGQGVNLIKYPVEVVSPYVESEPYAGLPLPSAGENFSEIRIRNVMLERRLAREYRLVRDEVAHVLSGLGPEDSPPDRTAEVSITDEKNGKIRIRTRRAPFSRVASEIGKKFKLNVISASRGLEMPVTADVAAESGASALADLCRRYGVKFEEIQLEGGGVMYTLKPGVTIRDFSLPESVPPEKCRFYTLEGDEENVYGKIVFFHHQTAALHLLFTLLRGEMKPVKLRVFATYVAGK